MTTLRIKLRKTTHILDARPYTSARIKLGNYSTVTGGNKDVSYSGFARAGRDGTVLLGVHLEKRKGKMVTVMKKVGRTKKETPVRKWQPTQWVMTITEIPVVLLTHLPSGSSFKQHKHHWEIITA